MCKERSYRELFNGIEIPVSLPDGNSIIPINFDNAATTPPFKQVDSFVAESILMYGSVGRGGQKSNYCTEAYEISREKILNFFGVSQGEGYIVVYVKNTTEGINFLANTLCMEKGNKVLATRMEHHANDLPWRQVANMFYIDVDDKGKLCLAEVEEKLRNARGTINYVTITGASNVTGHVSPIHNLAKLTHKYGARLILDAAQLVAHRSIKLKGGCEAEDIDCMIFSGHKMYAPFGSGVIVIKEELLNRHVPSLVGGGAVEAVLDQDVYWKQVPYRDEAGTPNYLGVMSLVAATTILEQIGFAQIEAHENMLKERMIKGLKNIPHTILYGDCSYQNRVGVVPFNVKGMQHERLTKLLQDKRGIALRNGCFCAHPYVMRLLHITDKERYQYLLKGGPQPGMIRASFGLYNTVQEVDEFLNVLEGIVSSDPRGDHNIC